MGSAKITAEGARECEERAERAPGKVRERLMSTTERERGLWPMEHMTPERIRGFVQEGREKGVLDEHDEKVLLSAAKKIEILAARLEGEEEVVAEGWMRAEAICGTNADTWQFYVASSEDERFNEPVALVRRRKGAPRPSNADDLARIDPRYLRHLQRCEDYAVEQGFTTRTAWEGGGDQCICRGVNEMDTNPDCPADHGGTL